MVAVYVLVCRSPLMSSAGTGIGLRVTTVCGSCIPASPVYTLISTNRFFWASLCADYTRICFTKTIRKPGGGGGLVSFPSGIAISQVAKT